MKKLFFLAFVAFAAAACSDDKETPLPYVTVDFEHVPASMLAGPTSYGDNCYESKYQDGEPFTSWIDPVSGLSIGIQLGLAWGASEETHEMTNGATIPSSWNIRSNPADKSGDWWYSYFNQCSVYNTVSADSTNTGAGHSGSNFIVAYESTSLGKAGECTLPEGVEKTFVDMWVCNASYVYGSITIGNDYCTPLKKNKGWFKLVVRGYRAGADEPVAEDAIYLADYRSGAGFCRDKWTRLDLTNIKQQPVNRIDFHFEGSDTGDFGLNTPTYVCIDDIRFVK